MSTEHPLHRYLRPSAIRTANCPGCGNGILAQAILRALAEDEIDPDEFVFVSGIGCAAWIPSPQFHVDMLHTTHGRPIAFATGVKLAAPDRRVMVVSGDGDLLAIGGNHFIHAARRNIDMTVICVNNGIYGMTGGQVAPTTPMGVRTATSPWGNIENSFDICDLATAAGATFVARWTVHQSRRITRTLRKALAHKGFSLIEVVSTCPVQYGRKTGMGSATRMLDHLREASITGKKAAELSSEERATRIVVGEFVEIEKPVLTVELARQRELAREETDGTE